MVRQVAALATNDLSEMYEVSLMLMECDSGGQRSFFRTFEFDGCGSIQCGRLRWNRIGTIWRVDSLKVYLSMKKRGVGEVVRKANTGVRRHGMRSTVLNKIASGSEEAGGNPGLPMSGQRANSLEAWGGGRQRRTS